jgi:transcription-repair coupling factor (superfamily II helicase)
MQQNSNFELEEVLPFFLKNASQKEKIVFISESHILLDSLAENLKFLECNIALLTPRISYYLNHSLLDNYSFLKDYVQSFEEQRSVTLIHASLLNFPIPEPDSYGCFKLSVNQETFITEIAKKLTEFGYTLVSVVHNPSEFAIRGYILDFATTEQNVRIELVGNKIEAIKLFEIENQRSLVSIKEVVVYPNKLLLPSICNFEKFEARYQIAFQEENSELFHTVRYHPESCDINKYTKLLVSQTINVLEILKGRFILHNTTLENILQQKELIFFEKQHGIPHGVFYFSQKELSKIMTTKNFETIATL